MISLKERKGLSSLLIIIIIVLAAVVIALVSAIIFLGGWLPLSEVTGSGDLVTQQKDFSDFTVIEAASGFKLEIFQSSLHSIAVTADDNVIDHIQLTKTGETLKIGLERGILFVSVTLDVDIGMPELISLELSGGSQGIIEDIVTSNTLSVDLSGGSKLRGDFVTSENVNFDLSGGSQLIDFNGEANDMNVRSSEGSQLELSDFIVQDANIDLSGGSLATINLDGRLNAILSGGSTLFYLGDPTLEDIDVSGGSTIDKK